MVVKIDAQVLKSNKVEKMSSSQSRNAENIHMTAESLLKHSQIHSSHGVGGGFNALKTASSSPSRKNQR
jgi:hypothetical protein